MYAVYMSDLQHLDRNLNQSSIQLSLFLWRYFTTNVVSSRFVKNLFSSITHSFHLVLVIKGYSNISSLIKVV